MCTPRRRASTGPVGPCNPKRGRSSALLGNVNAKGAKGGLLYPSLLFLFFPFLTHTAHARARTPGGWSPSPPTPPPHINIHAPSRSKIRSDRYVFSAMPHTGESLQTFLSPNHSLSAALPACLRGRGGPLAPLRTPRTQFASAAALKLPCPRMFAQLLLRTLRVAAALGSSQVGR